MEIKKNSRIVEVFSKEARGLKDQIKAGELEGAKKYVRDLASNPNPNNVYEISSIMSFVIDSLLEAKLNYLDLLADVQHTALGQKAQFQVQYNGLRAYQQAKSTSTERSKLSNKYVRVETDEVSIRPVVDFLELQTGKQDLVDEAAKAAERLNVKIAQIVQDKVFAAFQAINTSPNFAAGAGIVKATFDPLVWAMRRLGGSASIVGDPEVLTGLTSLTGYSNYFSQKLIDETNQNGLIGRYLGADVVQLNNPLQPDRLDKTELRKDLIYVVPTGDAALRPIKVALEGSIQQIGGQTNINGKAVEFRFDQFVGCEIVGARKALSLYSDTNFSA